MAQTTTESSDTASKLAADIIIAWLHNPNVQPGIEDVPHLLKSVLSTFAASPAAGPATALMQDAPAAPSSAPAAPKAAPVRTKAKAKPDRKAQALPETQGAPPPTTRRALKLPGLIGSLQPKKEAPTEATQQSVPLIADTKEASSPSDEPKATKPQRKTRQPAGKATAAPDALTAPAPSTETRAAEKAPRAGRKASAAPATKAKAEPKGKAASPQAASAPAPKADEAAPTQSGATAPAGQAATSAIAKKPRRATPRRMARATETATPAVSDPTGSPETPLDAKATAPKSAAAKRAAHAAAVTSGEPSKPRRSKLKLRLPA